MENEMEATLLATKLFIPQPQPGLVARPRLLERMCNALSFRLVLVSAPAGFGKTTLVSEWVRTNKARTRIAWLSLDEGDNDPARFWDYFVTALKTVEPVAGEKAMDLLHSPQLYPIESTLTGLINDLSTAPEDFAVVLDDYHAIKTMSIHNGITFLIDHLPPRMHIFMGTREDPALPLARYRGRGTMLEIHADDLRFTLDEAILLLQDLLGPVLDTYY
jgi:LuxR family transcriptional regulator, maltose regulon positive regulatory protein